MTKDIRIIQIGKYYPPCPGGIETMVKNIAESLFKSGFKSDVLCFSRSNRSTERRFGYAHVFEMKQEFIANSAPISLSYIMWMIKNLHNYDIIHVHLPNPLALLPILLNRYNPKSKIVVHWHSDIVKQKLLYKLVRPFEQYVLKKSSRIICTSSQYAKHSTPLNRWRKKCIIIPIGINDPDISNEDTTTSINIAKKFETKEVVFIGRLVPYKGLDYLIRSFKMLPADYNLKIVGDGPLFKELTLLVQQLELTSRVTFVGKVSDEEKHHILRNTGLLALPSISKNEAFGVVLLESMAHSTPVISTNIKGSATGVVNDNGNTGWVVEPMNSKEIADAIIQAFSTKKSYTQLCINSRKRFKSLYFAPNTYKKIAALYNQLLTDH